MKLPYGKVLVNSGCIMWLTGESGRRWNCAFGGKDEEESDEAGKSDINKARITPNTG